MRELVAELDRRVTTDPGQVVAVDGTGPHTLGAVLAAAGELADTLAGATGPGPTVLVQAENTWRTVVCALAVGRVEGTLALLSGHATPQEFAAAREDLDPDVVIAAPATARAWGADAVGSARASVLEGWSLSGRAATRPGRWGGGVVIGLTSGSTGRAKGVVQTEAALRYAGRTTIEAVGLRAGDPVAALVPLSSAAAVCFGLYLPLMLGGPILLAEKWSPPDAVALMAEHSARWTMCVPTMALQMGMKAPEAGMLSAMSAMTVGGGPMDRGALARAEQRLGTRFLRVFGMSECLGHTTSLPSDPEDVRLGTDGVPFPGTHLRVVDGAGAEVPAGTVGRAQVRGPSLFAGYARAGAVTAPDLTADGYLTTGDLMSFDADGRVSVRGREKDIIIRGGRNIDIHEVESAVARHPSVDQVCVVPVPDAVLGERVAVLLVTTQPDLGLDALQTHLGGEGLAKGKWPEHVFVVDALPQNRVGKLSRPDATRLAESLAAGTD
ncbi:MULTISPECIES: class I adenylate-forming enzyme family protein [Pseudonocardia]|uniref:Short-chain-fatty-acid--CoA ligase n=2 Tax=Pseudonocardia TaxID=1847 RepID=A0A1Y2MRA9_PSEAH|nr:MULTISPECIES: class I adenylate-forming enzyme family protein [Pseudonocardia]OSY37048.1 Short-chain-fatty-acid--CoA ligase [Pseudonocardia autotrophica]TDN72021.1 acyl-CoA synthetase (AMP-forming)/AMP-acid ligase II [Pseudonocardia autotrophica]BBG02716.1 malonyl-CoA synthase [Pseudonocardia autotrophica]GEC25951.1 malonyl-CoA synthase [Pseudonocardia saturnea]